MYFQNVLSAGSYLPYGPFTCGAIISIADIFLILVLVPVHLSSSEILSCKALREHTIFATISVDSSHGSLVSHPDDVEQLNLNATKGSTR
jgi:hypothetical protein